MGISLPDLPADTIILILNFFDYFDNFPLYRRHGDIAWSIEQENIGSEDFHSILNLPLTCRRLNAIISPPFLTWDRVSLNQRSLNRPEDTSNSLLAQGVRALRIDLQCCPADLTQSFSNSVYHCSKRVAQARSNLFEYLCSVEQFFKCLP